MLGRASGRAGGQALIRSRNRCFVVSMAGGASDKATTKRVVLWFRGTCDLRLTDNAIVHEAERRVRAGTASEVLPVFCFDPRWFAATSWQNGHLKTGPYRAKFLLESVLDLKRRLQGVGSDLMVAMGPPEKVLPSFAGSGALVLAQSEVTSEETRAEVAVKKALKKVGAGLELLWGSTMYHLDDLPFKSEQLSDMSDVFTPFKQKVEERCQVRPCLPPPKAGALPLPPPERLDRAALEFCPTTVLSLQAVAPTEWKELKEPAVDARAALAFEGGETAALARLRYYLWDSKLASTYFEIRNGMKGGDYSTKLAPALAHGCISPRTIYDEVKRYEAVHGGNKSTYWIIFELTWRDFFKFYALKHGDAIFRAEGPAGAANKRWADAPELLTRWKEGRTGWPLVDANMRELAASGFMSNRGRQNVASFLALDLGLDWRAGADWFESLLLDYDPASNWGNWAAAAGVTGGRVNKFNITKQSKDYDPAGEYIKHWVPELARVSPARIHEPWQMSKAEQEAASVCIGVDYPVPIPSSAFAGRSNGGSRGGGGGNSSSRRGGRGGGRGNSSRGSRQDFRPRSAFDMYG